MLNALLSEDGSISENLSSVIDKTSKAYKTDKNLYPATKRVFKAYKKALQQFSEANQGMNAYNGLVKNNEDGERYSLPIGDKIVDARTVTEEDVRTLLDNAFNKQYKDGSYIPVRVNTPSILIEAAQSFGKNIDNLPIILNVGKARQMLSSQKEWATEQKGGTAHNFAVDDVISLIRAMDSPKQIVYQSIDERYVEVVEFKTAEKQKAVAVLEIGENKNPEYLNGYNGGFYQVLVTAFEPDAGYIERILNKNGNIRIYPKKKGSSQRGSGNQVPSHLNDSPFAISITNSTENVNTLDENYLNAVKNNDVTAAQKIVDKAAKAAGYTDKLYHGTKQFGFTKFDPAKSDDKISLFAAGSSDLAQTYSGKFGAKKISEISNVDNLDINSVVKMLNEEASQSYEGRELKTEYEIIRLNDVNKLINEVNNGIEELKEFVNKKVKEYAEKMATDFNDSDANNHQRLISLQKILEEYRYDQMSTPIYMLLHYGDAFSERASSIADLEYKIRLMNKLTKTDVSEGVVIKKDLDGYGISILTFDKAIEELKTLVQSGNYALYGKPGRQLVVDAKGQNWNNIKNWISSAYYKVDNTEVKKDNGYFRLYNKQTGEQIIHGRIEITENNKNLPLELLHGVMVQKANNVLSIRSEYMHTTREIARFAKDEGYDSIKLKNLVDNGGVGESVDASDVYVYFNSKDLKSADPVTYDDEGNIIPISKRFDLKNDDIRYSISKGKGSKPSFVENFNTTNQNSVYNYNKEQYNSFGWVRQNDVINSGYWKAFTENFSQAVTGLQNFPRTSNGEFMIEAYDKHIPNSSADVIVYASGTIENPIVSKIVKLNPSQKTDIDEKRRLLYETERRGVQPEAEGIFDVYHKADFSSKLRSSGNRTPSNSYNNRLNTKRSRSEIKTNPITQFYIDEERNTITFFYSNGTQTTESLDSPKKISGRFSLSTPTSPTASTPNFVDPSRKSVTLQSSKYKPKFGEVYSDAVVASQIAFTNAEAGLERFMGEVGFTKSESESMVQYTRLASAQANNIIGGSFVDIGGNGGKELKVIGKGLVETLSTVIPQKFTKEGNTESEQRYADFQLYGFHKHNIDRMSLEENAKKKYLPQDIVSKRLKDASKKLRNAVKLINRYQGELAVYRREGDKFKGKAEARVKENRLSRRIVCFLSIF